jgi:serine/threonine protein kinase
MGCNRPLIQRDVKATNILLNARLEATIADFDLSKAFSSDDTKDFNLSKARMSVAFISLFGRVHPYFYFDCLVMEGAA